MSSKILTYEIKNRRELQKNEIMPYNVASSKFVFDGIIRVGGFMNNITIILPGFPILG